MILKTTYRSHFFFKKNFKKNFNNKKKIFTKSIIIFILFFKFFFKNFLLSVLFKKQTKNKTNILKAPSRHKKFFHQIFIEYFCVVFNWHTTLDKYIINIFTQIHIFVKLNLIFLKIGTNTMNKTKFNIIFLNNSFVKHTTNSIY